MALNLFDTSALPPNLKLHNKVELLLGLPGERSIVEDWSQRFEDRDGKFTNEFQSTFHSAFFELYLFALLKAQQMVVDLTQPRPDFLVTAPFPIIIEAVTAGIREDGRPEHQRNQDDVLSMFTPPWRNPEYPNALAESVVRYSNAICKKALKYHEAYAKLPWVSPDDPYVIAMGSFAQVNYGSEYHYSILALLYGQLFNASTRQYTKASSIPKPGNGAPININLFAKEEFRHVSAVLFTCTLTLGKLTSMAISVGHPSMNIVRLLRQDNEEPFYKIQEISSDSPEDLFDGLFVLHNSNAAHPLPNAAFAGTSAIHVRAHASGLTFEGENIPLVARLSLSRAVVTPGLMNLIAYEAFTAFNEA
jgi:hypothetical protein